MDNDKVATLADDVYSKRQRRDMLAMRNTAGLSEDERRKLNIEYHVADADYWAATRALHLAKMGIHPMSATLIPFPSTEPGQTQIRDPMETLSAFSVLKDTFGPRDN